MVFDLSIPVNFNSVSLVTSLNLNCALNFSQEFDESNRPVWFVFSGMGSQWPQMGKELMKLPSFRRSIERCHEILKQKGLDLIEIITTSNPKIFDNILHSFVGIAAIQVRKYRSIRNQNQILTPSKFIICVFCRSLWWTC